MDEFVAVVTEQGGEGVYTTIMTVQASNRAAALALVDEWLATGYHSKLPPISRVVVPVNEIRLEHPTPLSWNRDMVTVTPGGHIL